jgi:tetratricopeptide (TPR) repeat protein
LHPFGCAKHGRPAAKYGCGRRDWGVRAAFRQLQTHINAITHLAGRTAEPFLERAIAANRRVIELDPKYAPAHSNLADALSAQGRPDEAIASYRRAIELGYKGARQLLARAERLAAARDRFADFQRGLYAPATAGERIGLAEWCKSTKRYHTATRLYADAFAADPKLADDLTSAHRYDAAGSAALAAAGKGQEAGGLDEAERARLRQQALEWLSADLTLWATRWEGGRPADRAAVQSSMAHWQRDGDLAAIHDPDSLAKLAEPDRKACEALWRDVAALLERAEGRAR